MPKYYTAKGDDGLSYMGCAIASKDSALIIGIGDVDELNSLIGLVIVDIADELMKNRLISVQNKLFVIGAELGGIINPVYTPKNIITNKELTDLELIIDDYSNKVGMLKKFVLPGGVDGAAKLQYARAVSRRVERSIVKISKEHSDMNKIILKYLNRLSTLLFVMALYLNKKENYEEINPSY